MTFIVPEHILAQDLGDEVILLNLVTGDYHGLNGVGAVLWRGILAGRNISELGNLVFEQFEAPMSEIEIDVSKCIEDLCASGLLLRSGL